MLIIGCSNSTKIAKSIARRLGKPYSGLSVKKFPDSELNIRFMKKVKGRDIVLVQSFYDNKKTDMSINDQLIEIIFAARTAERLGARSITLAAPYFPYFRQDKEFHHGECVSIKIVAHLMNECLSRIIVIDPHLHRLKSMYDVFTVRSKRLTADPLIADYIKKNVKNAVIIGPDWESYRWAEKTAEIIGCECAILHKTRYSARKVDVRLNKKIDLKNKSVVVVDDIISTGHTVLETIKDLKKLGAKKFTVIGVHGLLVEGALSKLKKAGAKVITTNTIAGTTNKIDIAPLLADALKKK
ncbi:ribose-phosphate diphosphokinase [Candidatus Woesearchaeota archaeon]|nr:ribose-phosphate diphosphokinase [Candidatus Woesearchaeota archaeon]